MISTTAPLPLPVPNTERDGSGSSGSLETPREDGSTLSFASRLDQQITQRGPQRSRPDDSRSSAAQSREYNAAHDEENAPATSDSGTEPSSSPAAEDKENAAQTGRAKPSAKERETEKEPQNTTYPASASASAAAFTPVTLAIANGTAPAPVPAANAALTQESPFRQGITAAVPVIQPQVGTANTPTAAVKLEMASAALIGQTADGVSPAGTNPAAATPSTAPNGFPFAQSLNIPGVPMDSRAVVQNAAPGVVNALPQNTTVTPTGLTAGAAVQNNLSPVAVTSDTPTTQIPAGAAITLPANSASGIQAAAAALIPSGAATISTSTAQAIAIPIAQPVSIAPTASNETANPASAVSENHNDKTTKENHLDGIERLFTLNTGKAAAASANLSPASITAGVGQRGANSAVAAVPSAPSAHHRVGAVGIPVPAAVPVANVSAAPDANLPSLVSDGQGIGTSGSAALHPGSLQQALAAGLRSGSLTQPTPASEIPGATLGNGEAGASALLSSGSLSSNADADQQEQSGAQNHSPADVPTTSGAANPDGSAAVTTAGAARDANSVSATASVTNANGSSQIDRAHVVEQVTRHLESMRITGGNGEMRMHLAPQHLGSVQVTVSTHQDGVIARIAVESAQVQQVMEHSKEHLRSALEARGLHVRDVEVTVSSNLMGQNSAAFNEQRNRQTNAEHAEMSPAYSRPNVSRVSTTDKATQTPITAPAALLSASRLDYRA